MCKCFEECLSAFSTALSAFPVTAPEVESFEASSEHQPPVDKKYELDVSNGETVATRALSAWKFSFSFVS